MYNSAHQIAALSLCFLLNASSAYAHENGAILNGAYNPVHPEPCTDSKGLHVQYLRQTSWAVAQHGSLYSFAFLSPGSEPRKPMTMVDTEELPKLPPAFQEYVHAHECAHHRLGHTYEGLGLAEIKSAQSGSEHAYDELMRRYVEREKETDMRAIEWLVAYKSFGVKEMEIIAKTWEAIIAKYVQPNLGKGSLPKLTAMFVNKPKTIREAFLYALNTNYIIREKSPQVIVQ